MPGASRCVSQGKDEQKALENIKEAIQGWLWAEDQKAISKTASKKGKQKIVVTV